MPIINAIPKKQKEVESSSKLSTARSIQVDLSNTSSAKFDGTSNITPGVTNTLGLSNGGTGATNAESARNNIGAAAVTAYTATLATSNWGGTSPYIQTVNVSGITSNDEPIIDCVLNDDVNSSKTILKAWGCVGRITTSDNSITAYCYEKVPSADIPIIIKVVK